MKKNMNPLPDSTLGPIITPPVTRNGNGSYGCSDLAQKVEVIVNRNINQPEINKTALRILAGTSGRAGESSARELAARSFGAANNQHVEEMHGVMAFLEHQIAGASKHSKEISTGMNPAQRYIRSKLNGTPWTKPDKVKCGTLIGGAGVLLAIGVNTNATVLQGSGIAAFEHSISAYLFSGIPIALALGLKALASHIEEEKRRGKYIVIIWIIGLLFGMLWAYLFAGTFQGLTQTTAQLVRSLTEGGAAESPTSNVLFVFVAIMAETCLSAGCLLTAQKIAETHQLEELTDNPAHLKQQSDLDRWGKIHHEYVQLHSQLTGKLQALEDKSRAYIEEVVNFYRAAVKAAADNQRLDDFLGS